MAQESTIRLLVITPERQLLDEAVDEVVLPAHDGELGVLRDRAPLMCELGIGQLRYARGGQPPQRVFIDGGFAQVLNNRVTVLTRRALPAELVTAEVLAAAEQSLTHTQGPAPEALAARDQARRRLAALRRLARTA